MRFWLCWLINNEFHSASFVSSSLKNGINTFNSQIDNRQKTTTYCTQRNTIWLISFTKTYVQSHMTPIHLGSSSLIFP
jgi:hypothetical protein